MLASLTKKVSAIRNRDLIFRGQKDHPNQLVLLYTQSVNFNFDLFIYLFIYLLSRLLGRSRKTYGSYSHTEKVNLTNRRKERKNIQLKNCEEQKKDR